MARTSSVCEPSSNSGVVNAASHASKSASTVESIRHSNDELPSLDSSVKLGVVSVVAAPWPGTIPVFGTV
jgi:hypothetical protein